MLRLFVTGLLLIGSTLFSLEKTCVFDGTTKESLVIESYSDRGLKIENFWLENKSDAIVRQLFLSINENRDQQKNHLNQDLIHKKNLWAWGKDYQANEKGIYSSLVGSSLSIPNRVVPNHQALLREYFFDGKWHLVDSQHKLVYLTLDNNSVAGYEDIADDPFLVLRTKTTKLEEPYHFVKSCAQFAQLNIFPDEFDCFTPESEALGWHDYHFDLYPREKILFDANGTIEHIVSLNKRGSEKDIIEMTSAYPITQIVNHSLSAVTLEDQNFLLESGETYQLESPAFVLHLRALDPEGTLSLISHVNELPRWHFGTNTIDLGIEKNPAALHLHVNYDLKVNSFTPSVIAENRLHHFDHVTPYFELASIHHAPEKIWWQISSDREFNFLIPNFQAIEDFKPSIQLDACADTFFNPQQTYYFRVKGLQEGYWSQWSPTFEFTVSKPEQIKKPLFKKIGENQYQICWDAADDSDTRYHVFASNAFDFMPSIYTSAQTEAIENGEVVSQEINNQVAVTTDAFLNIGTEYAFYRVIAEKNGQYSTPSPLIRVYDYGLSIPRDVLQTVQVAPETYRIERKAFPAPYPCESEPWVGKSRAIDVMHLLKSYYTPSPYVDGAVWFQVQPFFLPENHPVKPKLDRLFSKRVTKNSETLKKAGFTRPDPMKFSKTIVSPNKDIPGYMFKFFCDDQKGISDWQRLLNRVTGAIFIQDALNRYNINHLFVVPQKWIYPLPPETTPVGNPDRKNFIVVETALDIYTGSANNNMWKSPIINQITLTWVFYLLQELGLSDSPYSFNMPITKDNRIAFIDTEHHHKWPVPLYKLWPFLASPMGEFWNFLCDHNK